MSHQNLHPFCPLPEPSFPAGSTPLQTVAKPHSEMQVQQKCTVLCIQTHESAMKTSSCYDLPVMWMELEFEGVLALSTCSEKAKREAIRAVRSSHTCLPKTNKQTHYYLGIYSAFEAHSLNTLFNDN